MSIDRLIKDNGILEDDTTLNTRKTQWGDNYNNYKLDEEKYKNEKLYPITITERNGKFEIEDGRHRAVALRNAGYKNVEVLHRKGE